MLNKHKDSLTTEIINLILEADNQKKFLKDLYEEKCHSGIVPKLNNKKYIYKLFDKYYEDIEDVRQEFTYDWDYSVITDIKTDFTHSAIDSIIE